MSKLTPAQKRALTWIEANEPVCTFPCNGTAPSTRFVGKLVDLGFVESCGQEAGRFGFTKFALTDHGRSLLRPSSQQETASTPPREGQTV